MKKLVYMATLCSVSFFNAQKFEVSAGYGTGSFFPIRAFSDRKPAPVPASLYEHNLPVYQTSDFYPSCR